MIPEKSAQGDGALQALDESMAELSLLVPTWQVDAVAEEAQSQGVSAGQFLRQLLQQALKRFALCRKQGYHMA